MKKIIKGVCVAMLAMIPMSCFALGDSADILSPLAKGYLERGREMTREGNPLGAMDQLRYIQTSHIIPNASESQQYAYLLAMAMYELNDSEAVDLLRKFSADYPASPLSLGTSLAEADYFFFNARYPEALVAYNKIDFQRINPDERPMYDYRKALCDIRTGHYDEADKILINLKSQKGFSNIALYYRAYIDYVKGNYSAAKEGFTEFMRNSAKDLDNELNPKYYITQIDYATGNYSEAAAMGSGLLENNRVAILIPETLRATGLSYFKLGNYDMAYPYLQQYLKSINKEETVPDSDALYASGAIEYARGDNYAAAQTLESVASEDSPAGQGASLILGQISASAGDNSAAAISFDRAYKLGFDPDVSETAFFNYIAARTHGGNIPFSSSIDMLETFLKAYPASRYASTAREYLATAYYHEKDYAKALASIEKISKPSRAVLAAKQKITFELGRQYASAGDSKRAAEYLAQSVSLSKYDSALGLEAQLWLADANYALQKYKEAQQGYEAYIRSASSSTNKTLARYNLAYCAYMLNDYKKAAALFAEALKSTPALPSTLEADATTRMADCRYYSGDYRIAAATYDKVKQGSGDMAAYATFRHAVMIGLGGDVSGKLGELESMKTKFPDSRWLAEAILEKGLTYAALDQPAKASVEFETLVKTFPDNPGTRKGLLNLALSYSRQGEEELSARTYQNVIERWPSSEEARLANEDLRRWHAAHGTLTEYSQFLENIPNAPKLDAAQAELLEYEAAEEALSGKNPTTEKLEKYVAKYPDGKYVANALATIAEEAMDAGDNQKALAAYRQLAAKGGHTYAAEAYIGIMRTTDSPEERIRYARMVIATGGVSAEVKEEATLYEAIGLEDSGNWAMAETRYSELMTNPDTEAGAQAAVRLGEGLLAKGQIERAEKVLSDFTDRGSSQNFWLARGFIALADVYEAQGRRSLALEYIKSLRDNYPGDEKSIRDMISQRLKKWK